jgi:hypothetical protein
MSDYQEKRKEERKAKAKRYLVRIIVVVVAVWILSIAQSARSTAQANQELLKEPAFSHSLVIGGPDRFDNRYSSVTNVDTDKKVKEDDYLWSTLILQNTAHGPASSSDITIHFTRLPEKVLLSSTQYGSEGKVKLNEKKSTAKISFEEIGAGEYLYVFLPYRPESGSAPPYGQEVRENWQDSFTNLVERITVDTPDAEMTYYGAGFASR